MHWFAVAIGGAVGSLLRYALLLVNPRIWSGLFPIGLLLVNVLGSFALGLILGLLPPEQRHSPVGVGISVGLLGGFTTFSTFSFDSIALWQDGHSSQALVLVVSSCLLGILGAALGIWLASHLGGAQNSGL